MNRVGDAGLAIAIFIMFAQLGTVDYTGVAEGLSRLSSGVTLALGLLPAAALWAAVTRGWGGRQLGWLGRPRADGRAG